MVQHWSQEKIDAEVRRTEPITHTINELISRGVDARAIMSRLATSMVQLETNIEKQYPGRMNPCEEYLATARRVLAKADA